MSENEKKNNSMVIKLMNKIYNNWSSNKLKLNTKSNKNHVAFDYKLGGMKDLYQYMKPLRGKQLMKDIIIEMMAEDED